MAAAEEGPEDEERKLLQHFADVREHLEQQLKGFGELDLALTDLAELSLRCRESGMGADALEALDVAISLSSQQAEREEELAADDGQPAPPCLACDVDVAGSDSPEDARKQQAAVLSCAGDYLALFRCARLAEAQHSAALEADPSCLAAWLGRGQGLAERCSARARKATPDAALAQATLDAAVRCCQLLAAEKAQRHSQDEGSDVPLQERRACQCWQLLDDAVGLWEMSVGASGAGEVGDACGEALPGLAGLGLDEQLELLRQGAEFLGTPAASSVESLARRWLVPAPWRQQPLGPVDAVSTPLPAAVGALLVHSQAFCHPRLEWHVARWRAGLCLALSTAAASAELSEGCRCQVHQQAADAAALACHLLFVGYCVPCPNGPDSVEGEERILERARDSLAGCPASVGGMLLWLLVMMYEDTGGEVPASCRGASKAVTDLLALDAVAALIDRSARHPREEAALLRGLQGPPGGGAPPRTLCRAFYDDIVYPPWHEGVESSGVLPLPVAERLRQHFPWWRGAGRPRPRVLVAGCGSGHQVAVEVRTYADCDFVALDCSPRAVARAQRKLRAVLSPSDYARVQFVVGDILELDDVAVRHLAGSGGFDLIVCCGVLHHLPRPAEGLARLAAALAPGGVIQLATYSRLSVQTWQPLALGYLRQAPASRHLYGAEGALLRSPSREEVRVIRRDVLALPAGDGVRDLLVHFREFFTYAGILDLLFHPSETLYTLNELEEVLLPAARLRVIGVFFPDVNTDLSARSSYRKAPGAESDPRMVSLARWHDLEVADPDLFGRMHTLFLERDSADGEVCTSGKRLLKEVIVDSSSATPLVTPSAAETAGDPPGKRQRGGGEET